MKYPTNCDTTAKKLVFLIRAQGLMRVLYKAMTHWRYQGITQSQYSNMATVLGNLAADADIAVTNPAQLTSVADWIKSRVKYAEFLTKNQYDAYLKKHQKLFTLASGAERKLLDLFLDDETYLIDFVDVEDDDGD